MPLNKHGHKKIMWWLSSSTVGCCKANMTVRIPEEWIVSFLKGRNIVMDQHTEWYPKQKYKTNNNYKKKKKTKKVKGYKNWEWKSLKNHRIVSQVVVWVHDCIRGLEMWEFGVKDKKKACIWDLRGVNFLLKRKSQVHDHEKGWVI